MNKKRALSLGYEEVGVSVVEEHLEDLKITAIDRLEAGNEVVIAQDSYHGEITYTLMVKSNQD